MLPKWVSLRQKSVLNTFEKKPLNDMLNTLCSLSYYILAASGGSAYIYQMAAAVLRNPTAQVILAAWIAALAGLVAWYHI